MPRPTKFDLMRENRYIAEARDRGFPLSRNPIDALICEAQLQERAEPTAPSMEIDGQRYVEAPDNGSDEYACTDCAFENSPSCLRVELAALEAFGNACETSRVIYLKVT